MEGYQKSFGPLLAALLAACAGIMALGLRLLGRRAEEPEQEAGAPATAEADAR